MKKTLCPFSKPIIGGWCQCPHANLAERCAGKMTCLQADTCLEECYQLVDIFKEKSRFVLGLSIQETELTHQQLMKIRCGGLLGMQRLLAPQNTKPDVINIISLAQQSYGNVEDFPFSDVVRDIKEFSHRKKRTKKTNHISARD